jgi:hypothetical protein
MMMKIITSRSAYNRKEIPAFTEKNPAPQAHLPEASPAVKPVPVLRVP